MSGVLELTCELVRRASVTPGDGGCQPLVAHRLERAGFAIRYLPSGQVENLWATHGDGGPVFCFLGHTDVVPSGPVDAWTSAPFVPVIRDGFLYGRGTADMKGSVAAMVLALEAFVAAHPRHPGTIALLLTSDEEGDAIDGVRAVAETFRREGQRIDHCLVGEPTATASLGDTVRIGRRGSLSGRLSVHGTQGHVAYPHLADNPVHRVLPALTALTQRHWDAGSADFPPTSFQISSIAAGTGASNVIPGVLTVDFNFRYAPIWQADALRDAVESIVRATEARFDIHWHLSGEPFHTPDGVFRQAVREAVRMAMGRVPEENTAGGTSDGRFIAPLGAQVVELGPVNASIHKIDECVSVEDLERLPALYFDIVRRMLAP
ncbi:succinyl-diaminopimelate desuccinylase [Xanthomonadaceae bacterium JHOS43]|nr:succinyl-diaminopimelate desuccinylase [Xanthomonadaceae bacterium JHOS43]MCX7564364.1 succinyl-diaminopimelate desuccinylase [Xanthomonadaceae bacterium XH05]